MKNKKKKIAFLIYSLSGGGAERVIALISNALKDVFDVYVIVYEDKSGFKTDATIINLNLPSKKSSLMKLMNIPTRFRKLKKLKKDSKFDITVSFLPMINLYNVFSKCDDKIVTSLRSYNDIDYTVGSKFKHAINSFIFKKSDAIICCSNMIKEKVIKHHKVSKEKLKVIYNPIDAKDIDSKINEEIDHALIEWMNDSNVIISVGKLVDYKGYSELIDAFELLRKHCPDTKLILLGQDLMNGYHISKINELHLGSYVKCLGYEVNPYKYLKVSNLFVLSSYYEGFPNVMIEAMYCGLPVVSVDCPSGPKEILTNLPLDLPLEGVIEAEYGIISPPIYKIEQNISKLSTAMENGLSKSDYYRNQSLSRVKDFNLEEIKGQYIRLLNQLYKGSEVNESQ